MNPRDVYAICVAPPEPLNFKLYNETKKFLEDHVSEIAKVSEGCVVDSCVVLYVPNTCGFASTRYNFIVRQN